MELFLQNCAVSALEVAVERDDGGPSERRRLSRPYFFVGRNSRNDVQFDDAQVSQRHAYFQAVGGRVFCVDLASRRGVHWPSGPRPSGWVDEGQPLRIGRNLLRVSTPEMVLVRPADAEAPPAGPEVVVEAAGGLGPPVRWRMNHSLALAGGAPSCQVRLRHDRISRFHCSLVRGPLGVWAVDLLSRDGVRVNGERVPWARLMDGDRLQIGPFELTLHYERPAESRGPDGASALLAPRPASILRSDLLPRTPDQALLLPVMNEFNRMQQQMMDQFHQTLVMMAEMFSSLHREQAALVREELAEMRRLTQEWNALKAEQTRQAFGSPPAMDGVSEQSVAAGAPDEPRPAEAAPAAPSPGPGARPAPRLPASPDVHAWLSRRVEELQEERNNRWQKILQFITGGKKS